MSSHAGATDADYFCGMEGHALRRLPSSGKESLLPSSTVKGTVSNEFSGGGFTSATGLRGSERFEVGSGGSELVIGTFSGAITITRTAVSGLRR